MTDTKSFTFRLAIHVDEAAWEHTYGTYPGGPLRAHIESYLIAALAESAAVREGAITGAEVIGR